MYFAALCKADCRLFCCAYGALILWLTELGLYARRVRRTILTQVHKAKTEEEEKQEYNKTVQRSTRKKGFPVGKYMLKRWNT